MSSGAASREAHTRLYVNNNYEGLYTIVEWLDTDFLQKHFGENSGHMYKFVFDNDAALAGRRRLPSNMWDRTRPCTCRSRLPRRR